MARNPQIHCADCGDLLDFWGMCPHTDPEDAARMSSPVNCGKTLLQVLRALSTTPPKPQLENNNG